VRRRDLSHNCRSLRDDKQKLDAAAGFVDADVVGVLFGLGVALDGDGGDGCDGRVGGQAGEVEAVGVLGEFDFLVGFEQACGFCFDR